MALVDRNRWSNLQSDERIRVLSSCSSSSSALFENEHKGADARFLGCRVYHLAAPHSMKTASPLEQGGTSGGFRN